MWNMLVGLYRCNIFSVMKIVNYSYLKNKMLIGLQLDPKEIKWFGMEIITDKEPHYLYVVLLVRLGRPR
jgi:hypothetical protein